MTQSPPRSGATADRGGPGAGPFRINVAAELCGVPAATLRAWERRYGIPVPRRTPSAYRLYTAEDVEQINRVLATFAHPTSLRIDHVSTRRAGKRRFVDLHMHMPPSWTLQRAAALRSSVEQALMSEVPGLRATIQLLPM